MVKVTERDERKQKKNTQNTYVLFKQIEPKLIRNLGNVCTKKKFLLKFK